MSECGKIFSHSLFLFENFQILQFSVGGEGFCQSQNFSGTNGPAACHIHIVQLCGMRQGLFITHAQMDECMDISYLTIIC